MSSPSLPYDPDQMRREQKPGSNASGHVTQGQLRGGSSVSRRMRSAQQHHPRVLAALCYTVPIAPAWILLARSGNNRAAPFVRFHAAQSLVFHGMVAAAQIMLYLLLMISGGLVANDLLDSAIAIVLVVLWLTQAGIATRTWSNLVADCISGHTKLLPRVGGLALRLERFSPRAAWAMVWRWTVTAV